MEKLTIEKRRYIGCKAKLIDWIVDTIRHEIPNAKSFCDIFAGTAVVSQRAISLYKKVIVNDFLYSNNIIYRAFFEDSEYRQDVLDSYVDKYNALSPENIPSNYFSDNYGDKYFDMANAKRIGYVREDIEQHKDELTDKEYCILITSLIYSIDKIANTLGHFEAYIKKDIKEAIWNYRLIDFQCCDNVEIHREDANLLAREIKSDIVYVDPPYNSRQYSRFYHVYEVLVKWEKPKLTGIAMKPPTENMSEYCSSRAVDAFADLIEHLDTKFIVVSYNNTYHSKSKSSQNKISLEEILEVLRKKGETRVLEHSHKFFNAGKTDFSDHKELLFITRVNEKG